MSSLIYAAGTAILATFAPSRLRFSDGGAAGASGSGNQAGSPGGAGGSGGEGAGAGTPPPTGDGAGGGGGGETPPSGSPGGAGGGTPPPGPDPRDVEIEKLKREAQGLRAKVREHEDKSLGELEKAKRDAEEAARARTEAEQRAAAAEARATRSLVEAEAAKRSFVDPSDAHALLGEKLKADGSNAGALLDQLAKDKPYLVKTGGLPPTPPGGAGGSGNGKPSPEDLADKYPNLGQRIRRFGGGSGK